LYYGNILNVLETFWSCSVYFCSCFFSVLSALHPSSPVNQHLFPYQ